MIELNFQIASFLREAAIPLLDAILTELSNQEGFDEKRYEPPPDDADFRETWLENLRADQGNDLLAALRLVRQDAFGTESAVLIEASEAEAALRGFTAARLRIHETSLSEIADIVLEQGDLDFENLLPDQQLGYLGYFVAAAVQERIVDALSI